MALECVTVRHGAGAGSFGGVWASAYHRTRVVATGLGDWQLNRGWQVSTFRCP